MWIIHLLIDFTLFIKNIRYLIFYLTLVKSNIRVYLIGINPV
jgi:hypothetical protein